MTKTDMLEVVSSIYDMLGRNTTPMVEETSAKDHVERIFHVRATAMASSARSRGVPWCYSLMIFVAAHRHQPGRRGHHRRTGRVVLARRADFAVAGDPGHGPVNVNVIAKARHSEPWAVFAHGRCRPGAECRSSQSILRASVSFQHHRVETPCAAAPRCRYSLPRTCRGDVRVRSSFTRLAGNYQRKRN